MTTAPELSAAEAAKVAEFDAAPEPPEIVVERMKAELEAFREEFRRRATAAIDARPFILCCDPGGDAWPELCPEHGEDNRRYAEIEDLSAEGHGFIALPNGPTS